MVKIFVLTRDSLLFILLVSTTSHALESSAARPYQATPKLQEVSQKTWDLEKALLAKGLEKEAAKQKAQKLFSSSPMLGQKLTQLASHKDLELTKEALLEQLTRYALYEKPCQLNTYAGMYGFVQKIVPDLSHKQKEVLALLTL